MSAPDAAAQLDVPRAVGPRRSLPRDALILVGLLWLGFSVVVLHYSPPFLGDAFDYWQVNLAHPYGTLGDVVNFAYAPPLALAFSTIGHVPLPLFLGLWAAMNVGLVVWLLWPRPWLGLVLAMPITDQLLTGQIELLMAALIVVSLRWPASWTLPVLAKPTVGVGALWFLVRAEWRAFLLATVPAAIILAASYLLAPDLWPQWLAFLGRSAGQDHQYLPIRLVSAAAIVVWGARTERRWTVIVAAVLALPVIYIHSLAMLAALPRIRPPSSRGRRQSASAAGRSPLA